MNKATLGWAKYSSSGRKCCSCRVSQSSFLLSVYFGDRRIVKCLSCLNELVEIDSSWKPRVLQYADFCMVCTSFSDCVLFSNKGFAPKRVCLGCLEAQNG